MCENPELHSFWAGYFLGYIHHTKTHSSLHKQEHPLKIHLAPDQGVNWYISKDTLHLHSVA